MKFQTGDYVLWEGEIERVVSVCPFVGSDEQVVLITWRGIDDTQLVMASMLAKHQHPVERPAGNIYWQPLDDQTQA